VEVINPSSLDKDGFPRPAIELRHPSNIRVEGEFIPIVLVEVPFDFQALKAERPSLALEWRGHTRSLFEDLFENGYLVTDFVFLPGDHPRSFYVLTHGDSTL
jgi:predicted GNAT superfamily acetyltransferase